MYSYWVFTEESYWTYEDSGIIFDMKNYFHGKNHSHISTLISKLAVL